MPEARQIAANGGGQQQQQQQQPNLMSSIFRMMFMWWMLSFLRGNKPGGPSRVLVNSFTRGEPVDVTLYVQDTPRITKKMFDSEPMWQLENVGLATQATEAKNLTVQVPERAKNNGSVYLHAFVSRRGFEINQFEPDFEPDSVVHGVIQMNKYMPKRKQKIQKNLLTTQETEMEEEPKKQNLPVDYGENKTEIISYWKNMMTVATVDDFSKYSNNSIPPHLYPMMELHPYEDTYKPMIFFNEFWVLKEKMIPLNETTDTVPLEVTVSSIKPWLVQLSLQFEQSLMLQEQWGMSDEEGKDSDEFKKILTESNPYLLGITMIVSLLHSVFEFMAFKSDVGFWRDNKSMKGISAKSILINTACQLIVTLYLLDNETNFMVMFGQIVGLVIECWKITKAMHVSLVWWRGIPMLHLKERQSYIEGNTKEHDDTAMRYLSYVLFPLVACYCVYTLIYEEHKSWYSWALGSLVGAVYTFGFILMCPQLYLNYKLKSVAHLPGKQLTYKFLTTVIDDLFAFAIKMPSLHRLAVFRDDLVFAAYLYQWYIYGVDKKRVNEFGYSAEAADDEKEESSTSQEIKEAGTAGGDSSIGSQGTAHRRKPRGPSSDAGSPIGHIEDITEEDDQPETKKGQ